MLDRNLIPTRLVEPAELRPVIIKVPRPPSRFHVVYLSFVFIKFFLAALLPALFGRLTRSEYARRLRVVFEDLGGAWIKLGQLLSLRTDVFSREFCLEMSKLQAKAEGFPVEMARQIIEQELGVPLENYFERFEEAPFAAASIGQVHRAVLRDEGIVVAIKVQRPYAAESLIREMAFVQLLIWVLERLWFVPNLQWQELLWELNQILAEELDYRYEAAAMKRMKKILRRHSIYVHKVFLNYSTRRLLVTEFVTAVLMTDYIRIHKSEPQRLVQWHEENNVDPKLVARRLFNSLWRQLLEDNLFHADLHPGNIILLRDSRLALIDFGAIGSMEREYQRKYWLMMEAMAAQDYAKAADCLFLISGALPPTDLTEVKQKLIRCFRSWELRTYAKGIPYHERSMSALANGLIKILFQYECPADWSFLRITRAQETVDQSLMHLNPDANYTKMMHRYFERLQDRLRSRALQPTEIRNFVGDLVSSLRLPQRWSENASFEGMILRRRALVFRGSTSKLAELFAVFLGRTAFLLLLATAFFFLVFLHQHHSGWVPDRVENWLSEELAAIPRLSYLTWIAILVFALNTCLTLASLKRRFSRKERAPINGS
jgi:ubiquinone biosynthesis protein